MFPLAHNTDGYPEIQPGLSSRQTKSYLWLFVLVGVVFGAVLRPMLPFVNGPTVNAATAGGFIIACSVNGPMVATDGGEIFSESPALEASHAITTGMRYNVTVVFLDGDYSSHFYPTIQSVTPTPTQPNSAVLNQLCSHAQR